MFASAQIRGVLFIRLLPTLSLTEMKSQKKTKRDSEEERKTNIHPLT
jgi:hypothetical protein